MEDTQKSKVTTPAETFVSEAENSSQTDEYSKSSSVLDISAELERDLEKQNKRADIKLKWLYGSAILIVLGFWEWFVIKVVLSQLNPNHEEIHYLSDTALVALLTSATANILTLPAIILKYLFPHKN